MRSAHTVLSLSLLLTLPGCCATPECTPEHLPAGGAPRTSEELFLLVRHSARFECYQVLYQALSARTRAEHSYFKLRLFLGQLRAPAPWEYPILDILRDGIYLGAFPGPGGRELILVDYQQADKPSLLAQILVVEERVAGEPLKRLALEEQAQEGPPLQQD